ncbi:hypothetical protein QFZ75_006574 [Streptomyces sp. V3I8]|uniref:hypothetical protein n=1 Tax=Streptomyces sp. V3I8 TaxID=3042279 RepID=UPI00278208E9|nr:hypothetical protein [Streptomyces sp. V3I8]MDQ1040158.1 hypothetical protein [Streptomyces sp. V3I8]
MHRTATTATLLVTVAVSAVSGCTTVQRPPSPAQSAAPPSVPEPRPDGRAGPRVVQAPAREALGLVGPPRRPAAPASTPVRGPGAGPAAAPADPPRRAPAGPSRRPEPRRPEQRAVPRPPPSVPSTNVDVCALGRSYGGWKADSPEAAVCEDVYGR